MGIEGSLAGRRVVVSTDGVRVRVRKNKRGKKTKKGRSRYRTDWREPKLLVIYVVDEQGRIDLEFTPVIDGTLRAEKGAEKGTGAYIDELRERGQDGDMPRTSRVAPGGMVFHVLNRRVGRMPIFEHEEDYAAFERVVTETLRVAPIRICAFCWMPNLWHFVLWPRCDGDLSEFMQRMANMHTQRWQHT